MTTKVKKITVHRQSVKNLLPDANLLESQNAELNAPKKISNPNSVFATPIILNFKVFNYCTFVVLEPITNPHISRFNIQFDGTLSLFAFIDLKVYDKVRMRSIRQIHMKKTHNFLEAKCEIKDEWNILKF